MLLFSVYDLRSHVEKTSDIGGTVDFTETFILASNLCPDRMNPESLKTQVLNHVFH